MRKKPPNRRARTAIEFDHWNHHFTGGIGHYADGSPCELFLTVGKTGTELAISVSDAAIALSLALQAGISAKVLSEAFLKNEDGSPAGPLGKAAVLIAAFDTD